MDKSEKIKAAHKRAKRDAEIRVTSEPEMMRKITVLFNEGFNQKEIARCLNISSFLVQAAKRVITDDMDGV
ncbi:hypothetical protein IOU64_004431 [Salmonella enterica]|nr:hypothetical protein [Salmonella enterica]